MTLQEPRDAVSAASPTRDDTFVMVACGVVIEGMSLDLVDLSPSTIRVGWSGPGHLTYLSTSQFLDLWEAAHSETAPAHLGLIRAAPVTGKRVRLQVRQPRIVGSGLRWTVTNEHSWLPHESGSCVLVINPPELDERSGTSLA